LIINRVINLFIRNTGIHIMNKIKNSDKLRESNTFYIGE